MTAVADLNNKAAALIALGKLDEAERTLERARAILEGRSPAVVDAKDLEPALDEYFHRSHRLNIAWLRGSWAEALPHAERAWELENAVYEAAREAEVDDLPRLAFSMGAWGIISALTRLSRFEEAEARFELVIGDRDFFWARRNNNRESAEKILIAGLCVYFERKDDAWMARGKRLITRAQELTPGDDPELVFGYACYWARLKEAKQACDALERALRLGIDPERMLTDADFDGIRQNRRFESIVNDRIFTFKVRSEPSGARLSVDDVDSGLLTPARMRPPLPGKHRLRLSLQGHRDAEIEHHQERACGADILLGLESLAVIAARERMKEDSTRAPDEAAKARTRAFLGDDSQSKRARVVVTRATTYGLGGLELSVQGDGRVTVRHEEFGDPRKVCEERARLESDQTCEIFEAFVEEAFTEMVVASHSGVPDELFFTVELNNGAGRTHSLGKFVGTRHDRFERLVNLVRDRVAAVFDSAARRRLTL